MIAERTAIEVGYTLTPEDARRFYDDFQALHRKKTRTASPFALATIQYKAGLIGAPAALYFLLMAALGDSPATYIVTLLFTVAWAVAFRRILTAIARKRFAAKAGVSDFWTAHHLSGINEDGIFDHSASMMWTIFWAQVEEIHRAEHTIIFKIKRGKTSNWIPIPRRAFVGDAKAQEFYRTAERLRSTSATMLTTLEAQVPTQ